MCNADQIIALLQRASTSDEVWVEKAYETLMGQLATHLVGEPLADGVVTEAEWVLLQYSLRQFSASPRSAAAWNAMRRQAAVLETALENAEAAPPAAPQPEPAPAPKRTLSSLRPSWFGGRSRNRATSNTTVNQNVGTISHSENVTIIGHVQQGGAQATTEFCEEDSAPIEPEQKAEGCDIFLSYCRRDARLMRRLRADLHAEGFTVWTDENLKLGSAPWLETVDQMLCSAMCVIVVLTPDLRKSEWVGKELAMAKIQKKEIIPLLARGDEQASLPLLLSNNQYADIRTEENYKKRIHDLSKVLHNLQRGAAVRA